MHKLLTISLALLSIAVTASGETCVSWDDEIEPQFLKPFREILGNSSAEFISFRGSEIGRFGFGASWDKGYAGNFSTVRLLDTSEGRSSAQVCTSGNVRRLTLDMNVGFDRLEAHLANFVFSLPFFKTESAWAVFTSTGSNAVVRITTAQDVGSKQCTLSLDNFEFNSWGAIELTLGGNAGRNLLAELFFNAHRAKIVKFLSRAGVGTMVNTFARNHLSAALENHSDVVCTIMA